MNPQMQLLRSVDEEFWLDVARECAYATFFHTPYWHELARVAFPGARDRSLGAVLDTGVRVVFPLLETGRSLKRAFTHLVSGAFGCYGGPIADGSVPSTTMSKLHDTVLKRRLLASLDLTGNPFSPFRSPTTGEARPDSTQVLHLRGKTIDELIRSFSKGHRAASRQGQRMGVSINKAETLRDFEDYYGAYEDSLDRWGDAATSRYSWELFREVWSLSQKTPESIELWLAKVADKVAAGALLFRWNRHCVYWHGAAYEEFLSYRAPTLLLASVLERCVENDVDVFDFNPSGGHEGVAKFKRGFGAEPLDFERMSYGNKTYDLCRQIASRLIRKN
jgi:hypothetical protein